VRRRLALIASLRAAGLAVGISLMPILPLVGDQRGQLDETIRAAVDHGAAFVIAGGLTFSGAQATRTLAAAETVDPTLPGRLRVLYGEDEQARINSAPPRRYAANVGLRVRELCACYGVPDRMPRYIAPGPLAINRRIAERLFLRTYDLELECASEQRVWAYRKAAWTVDEWQTSLSDLYDAGGLAALRALPTIGTTIAGEIAAWISETTKASASAPKRLPDCTPQLQSGGSPRLPA
jgi:hypothetical protein